MKICLIEDFYRPYSSGGASAYVIALADQLVAAGHQVSVITSAPTPGGNVVIETIEQITIYRIPTHLLNIPIYSKKITWLGKIPSVLLYWFNPWVYTAVKKSIAAIDPDVCHTVDTLYLSLAAMIAVRHSGRPWVHSLLYVNLIKPTGMIWNPRLKNGIGWWKLMLPLTRWLIRSPNVVITPSAFSLALHQRYGFFSRSETTLIPLGPMHPIHPQSRPNHQPKQFLTVGRMNREKGTLIVLRAFLAYSNPDARLTIIGTGPDDAAIRSLAQSDSRISVRGHLTSEELGQAFSGSDVYISASMALETFNLTISEAFHAGLPVIASNVGAQPELVATGCGLIFPPGDQVALTQAMKRYVEEPGLWTQHAAAALKRSQDFSFAENVRRTIGEYAGVLKQPTI